MREAGVHRRKVVVVNRAEGAASFSSESSGFVYRASHHGLGLPLLHGDCPYPLLFLLVPCCLYMSLLCHFLGAVKLK